MGHKLVLTVVLTSTRYQVSRIEESVLSRQTALFGGFRQKKKPAQQKALSLNTPSGETKNTMVPGADKSTREKKCYLYVDGLPQ